MSVLELCIVIPLVSFASYEFGFASGAKVEHRRLTREVIVKDAKAKILWLLDATTDKRAVGAFLIVMAVLVYQGKHDSNKALHQEQAQSACLTTYANGMYDSLHPRQAASEALQRADNKFNDAMVRLFQDALAKNPDPARTRADVVAISKAAQHKQAVAASLSTERAQNPYPQPPKKVCPK